MNARAHDLEPPHPSSGILFLEDFEAPEVPPAPEPVAMPPLFTDADLAQARADARAAGYEQGLAQARDESAEATRRAIEAIAAAMCTASDAATRTAECHADALARLLIGSLRTVLPTLCQRFGAHEAAAIATILRPGLSTYPAIRVCANRETRPELEQALCSGLRELAGDLCGRLSFIDAPDVAPGDVRLEWVAGAATRDMGRIWADIATVLSPLGLLCADAAALERAA